LIDRQEEICFRDKLSLFITVLEQCITETGDKAKALNKLHMSLIKTRVAYDHYSQRLGEDTNDDKNAYYDFYVCIMDDEH
jgi:signal transduction protein with GAF and PtsI domain